LKPSSFRIGSSASSFSPSLLALSRSSSTGVSARSVTSSFESGSGRHAGDVLAPLALDQPVLLGLVFQAPPRDGVERPELADQLHRGLGPDARHAGNIVRGVAHQREHVDDLPGLEPGLLLERAGGDQPLGVDVVHLRAGLPAAEQLLEVLVLADDPDTHLGVGGAVGRRDRGDDIVRLEALGADHRHADRLEHCQAPLHLRLQVLGRRVPVGFVFGVQLAAEGPPVARDIERHRDVRRRPVALQVLALAPQQLEKHADEAEGQVGRLLRDRAGHGRADRVVGAEELGVAVDEVERGHGGRISLVGPVLSDRPLGGGTPAR
jgi:hypothetical protein